MDDHEGKSFTRTPLWILKLPRLNEHDFVAGLGADLECTPILSSCAKVEAACDGDRSGGGGQEPASEAPQGLSQAEKDPGNRVTEERLCFKGPFGVPFRQKWIPSMTSFCLKLEMVLWKRVHDSHVRFSGKVPKLTGRIGPIRTNATSLPGRALASIDSALRSL